MTRNKEEARDLVGETILRAYENFDKIEDKNLFKSYVFSIASRLYRRGQWRKRIFGEYDESAAENLISNDFSAETNIDVQILYDAMQKLPEKQREAISLFEISGFSIEEIKEIQGGSISGVKSRLKRGRSKLKQLLSDPAQSLELSNQSSYRKVVRNEIIKKKKIAIS